MSQLHGKATEINLIQDSSKDVSERESPTTFYWQMIMSEPVLLFSS